VVEVVLGLLVLMVLMVVELGVALRETSCGLWCGLDTPFRRMKGFIR
jgi:hypothetical protein